MKGADHKKKRRGWQVHFFKAKAGKKRSAFFDASDIRLGYVQPPVTPPMLQTYIPLEKHGEEDARKWPRS
jgi:hypothetical protein